MRMTEEVDALALPQLGFAEPPPQLKLTRKGGGGSLYCRSQGQKDALRQAQAATSGAQDNADVHADSQDTLLQSLLRPRTNRRYHLASAPLGDSLEEIARRASPEALKDAGLRLQDLAGGGGKCWSIDEERQAALKAAAGGAGGSSSAASSR